MCLKKYFAIILLLSIHHVNGIGWKELSNQNSTNNNTNESDDDRSERIEFLGTLTELIQVQQELLQRKEYRWLYTFLARNFFNFCEQRKHHLDKACINEEENEKTKDLYMERVFTPLHIKYVQKHRDEIRHLTDNYFRHSKQTYDARIKSSRDEAAWYWDTLTASYLPALTAYLARKTKSLFITPTDKIALEHTKARLKQNEGRLYHRARINAERLEVESTLHLYMTAWHSLATLPLQEGIEKFQDCKERIQENGRKIYKMGQAIKLESGYSAKSLEFITSALRRAFSEHLAY